MTANSNFIQSSASIAVSVAISLCMLSDTEELALFGFYVAAAMNVLAWISVLCGAVKGDAAARIRSTLLIMLPSTFFSIYAAIFSGHPILAASTAIVSFFIVCQAYAKERA